MAKTKQAAGEEIPLSRLKLNPRNPRTISDEARDRLLRSIEQFPEMMELRKITVDEKWTILGGSQRVSALLHSGRKTIPSSWVQIARGLSPAQKQEFIVKDNGHEGDWDWNLLLVDYAPDLLADWGIKLPGLGVYDPYKREEDANPLADTYIVPPFTVLDSRQGSWQIRKKLWRKVIGDLGETRQGKLGTHILMARINAGVSIFDPVLAEIIAYWFTPKEKSLIFDCFAGDTVIGFVASSCGHTFTGVELRKEQAELNNARCKQANLPARYITDDGRNILNHLEPESQDLFFSCPPYFDLEQYSDLPDDASNQKNYSEFLALLQTALHNSIACLKTNRFAILVVGDIRDPQGIYRRFPSHVTDIILQVPGMVYLNELVLLTSISSAQIRARRQFNMRKNTKTHQNVLVFYKGDQRKVKEHFRDLKEDYRDFDFSKFITDETAEDGSENMEL